MESRPNHFLLGREALAVLKCTKVRLQELEVKNYFEVEIQLEEVILLRAHILCEFLQLVVLFRPLKF